MTEHAEIKDPYPCKEKRLSESCSSCEHYIAHKFSFPQDDESHKSLLDAEKFVGDDPYYGRFVFIEIQSDNEHGVDIVTIGGCSLFVYGALMQTAVQTAAYAKTIAKKTNDVIAG